MFHYINNQTKSLETDINRDKSLFGYREKQ